MRTPAGKDCKFYYQDFHRGRDLQECRLEKENPNSERWHPSDCEKCPVPDILWANADPDMQLKLTIKKGFLGFGRKVVIEATSRKDGQKIENPYVGRADDNPGLDIFRQAMDDLDHD
jgi:hypothetical protein